jgi:hypothetical protein
MGRPAKMNVNEPAQGTKGHQRAPDFIFFKTWLHAVSGAKPDREKAKTLRK